MLGLAQSSPICICIKLQFFRSALEALTARLTCTCSLTSPAGLTLLVSLLGLGVDSGLGFNFKALRFF